MLSNLWDDLRYSARRLGLSPGFATAAIVTIALGVGINTGIFSILNSVALRELPAPAADELVSIHQVIEPEDGSFRRPVSGARSMFSTSEYRAYRDGTETLSGLMGFSRPTTVTLGEQSPREVDGALVTCNYFDVLRQPPALGPGFVDACDAEGAAPTVVLGHDLWATAFDADPGIVGRSVLLNRQSFTVIGVAPEGMQGVDMMKVSFFAPIATQPLLNPGFDLYGEEWSWLTLIGRKMDGGKLGQVRTELGVIAARIDAEQPPRRTTLLVDRARTASGPDSGPVVFAIGGVVMTAFGLVLLIACANVANLLLVRASGRAREIALRLSLGATRARIVQQLLAESVLIAILGGALGVLLALLSFRSLLVLALSALPREASSLAIDAQPDLRVLTFALVLTIASGVLFGLAPALQASRPDLHTAAKIDAGAAGRSGSRLRGALLGIQVAVCMVLMISAGLLLRGLYATQTIEPGFTYENVAVAEFDLTAAGYDAARAADFQRRLLERVAALPGVDAVAQGGITPLTPGRRQMLVSLPGQEPRLVGFNSVSPGYFSLIGTPIVLGRTFTDSELADGSSALIVTEATARRLWPGRDALGQVLTVDLGSSSDPFEYRVVGVAKDAELTTLGEVDSDFVYVPAVTAAQARLQLLAKGPIGFAAMAAGMRSAAAELDPALVVHVTPLEANLDFWRGLAGLVSTLSTSLGALALVLASVGIYGVVAYAVARRVHEIGIRIALGAGARDILGNVLQRTMRPVVVGAVIGIAIAIALSRVLSSVLFGVSPVDPIGIGGATLVVAGIAAAAGVLAASPATRADPMVALREE